jgi:hypothetical protein
MIFKINDQPYNIPTSWSEVTFKQYVEMLDLKDDTYQLINIFTGIPRETLEKAAIIGLDTLLNALAFINKPPVFPGSVSKVGPYTIPNNSKGQFNIQHESLAQYEDMRQVMKGLPPSDTKAHVKAYLKYVAIYLQKIKDGEYKPLRVAEMEDELENYPAFEVCTLGAFFFLKLWSFSTGIQKTSPSTSPSRKRSKRVTTGSKKSLARSQPSSKRRGR